jgi:HAD superfamily hydrolase (TIGR01509 family)
MPMIEAVIYDLDDTMVNSDPLHARAWEELLQPYGHVFADLPEELRAGFIGMRVKDIVHEIADYLKLEGTVEELYEQRANAFLRIVRTELEPMPGLTDSLDRFKNAGYKLAVASSGARQYIDLVLSKFSITDYFDTVITGDDVTVGKPDPETYLVAASKLDVAPANCAVFEDATKGIQAAKAAGCICLAVINPNVPPQDVSMADVAVHSLEEISLETIRSFH